MRRPVGALAGILSLVASASTLEAQTRSLRWPALDVTAHLDSTGMLHVRERQTIHLSGDWNGPERTFHRRPGQRFTFVGMARIDAATGTARPLVAGDLSRVDDYAFTDARTLRWRSRLPTDPPHDATTLVYDLAFGYGNILEPTSSRGAGPSPTYRLDHDFAFGDRWEPIDRFTLTLTLDPAWRAPEGFTGRYVADTLWPGMGYVVTLPLTFVGAGRPAGVEFGAEALERRLLLVALVLGVALLFLRLIAHERRVGRFAPLTPSREITPAWLERHVLSMPPEVAGAAWDDTTAAPEVAATLARLVTEGKLESEVRTHRVWKFPVTDLHLRLKVPRNQLTRHDRALIDGLFFSGSTETSTRAIRRHYAETGFDPAATIRTSVQRMVEMWEGSGGKLAAPSAWPTWVLLLAAAGALIAAVAVRTADVAVAAAGSAIALFLYLFAVGFSIAFRQTVERPRAALWWLLVPIAAMVTGLSILLVQGAFRAGPLTLTGLTLLVLAFVTSAFNLARSRQDAERLAMRKRLASARAWFRDELRRPKPALDDAWFPWIIGFGLGRQVDRWFKAFGAATSGASMTSTSRAGSVPMGSSGSGSGWTGFGGGGGFAGGGSSASFAAAVGGMAASVPKPSSGSSGGGGGGGGGGSSGGGGGGGW